MFYRVIRRLGVLDVTRLMHLPAGECHGRRCPEGYEIRFIQRDELELLLKEERISSQVGNVNALDDSRRALVAAFHKGRVVSFAWFAKQAIEANDNFSRAAHLGISIDMPDGTAFVFNAWTDRDHRGKRLIAALLTWATRNRVCGAWSLLTMIDWTNEKSIKSFKHLGMQTLGHVYRLGRGRWQVSLVPESAGRIGFRVAEDAPGFKLAW